MTAKTKTSKRPSTKAAAAKVPVLVTTAHRGVFFGYLVGEASKASVQLNQCRNVLRWDTATKGFLGLCSIGPTNGCRVGPAAPQSTLYEITSVTTCTPEAVARFEAAPWA